jgi:hypothetical protein
MHLSFIAANSRKDGTDTAMNCDEHAQYASSKFGTSLIGFAAMKDEKKIAEMPEVEITPEMINAGVATLCDLREADVDVNYLVSEVFQAMYANVRRRAGHRGHVNIARGPVKT